MSDYWAGGVWGGVTALLLFACWRLAARMSPRDDLHQKALHALVLAWVSIVAAAVALGAAGRLTGPLLLVAVAMGSLGLLAAPPLLSSLRPELAHPFEGAEAANPRAGQATAARLVEAALWLFLLAFWAYHVARHGLLGFPDDFDTLMYHLPLIDHWLQAHSLYAPDAWQWSSPGNAEILGLWCAAPFSGDFLAGLANGPAVLILALASRELASQFGLGRLTSSACAAAVTANYVVFKQLVDVENDVAVAALTVASAAYALRYGRWGRRADLVLGGISLGLLAGVKFYALGYAAAAWFVLVAATAARQGFRSAARAGLVAATLALLSGGYWYARNTLHTGSPLYPKRLFTANDELAGYYRDVWGSTFLGNGSPELPSLAAQAVHKMAGPLHLTAACVLPLVLLWLIVSGLAFRRGRWIRIMKPERPLLAGLVLAAGVVLVCTPFAVEDVPGTLNHLRWAYTPVRYGMAFLSLAVLALGVGLVDVAEVAALGPRRWRLRRPPGDRPDRTGSGYGVIGRCVQAAPCLLLLGLAGCQIGACAPKFKAGMAESAFFAADAVLLGLIATLLFRRGGWRPALLATLAMALFIPAAAAGAGALSARWHAGYARFYDRMFERGLFTGLGAPGRPSERVCVLDFRPYPFFGPDRRHHVCQPHRPRSAEEFYDYLQARGVTLVAARFDFDLRVRGWESCRLYVAQKPDLFIPAKQTPSPYALYRVRPLSADRDEQHAKAVRPPEDTR